MRRKNIVLSQRAWQGGLLTVLIVGTGIVGILGIVTLHTAPTLLLPPGINNYLSASPMEQIADLVLVPTFFLRLPEFFTPLQERMWWQQQERVYRLLRGTPRVRIAWTEPDGLTRQMDAVVGRLPLFEVFKSLGLTYLVAVIFLLNACLVFRRHGSAAGAVLAFFFVACACYFLSSAPVVQRTITLHPTAFRLLVKATYVSAGAMVTLAHFAVLFPRTKFVVQRHSWMIASMYSYFGLTVGTYFAGITAFGTTFPGFCFWVVVIVCAFVHSLCTERDPFVKKQIRLSLTAPMLAGLFALFYLLPGVLGMPPVPLTYFALVALTLPYALPLAMDNRALYYERLEMEHERRITEQQAQEAKERLYETLHDVLLNNLAVIARVAEVSLHQLAQDVPSVRRRLQLTQELAMETSHQLRGFLQVLDERNSSWEAFYRALYSWGAELGESLGVTSVLEVEPAILVLPPPSPQLRLCLYRVYREAFVNVIKHAQADRVVGSLTQRGDGVRWEIQDNGVGFDPATVPPGHYGLTHIQKSVAALGGTVIIETTLGGGTCIVCHLPLH